jgi:alkylation response protein AidB-like acyl-CoA dehydrogenase
MDFAWDPAHEALRAEVRLFLHEHLTPELAERLYRSGVSHDDDFARALGERNWIAPDWPRQGFDALDAFSAHVITDELTRVDAPIYAVSTSMMVARVIKAVGSDQLRQDVLPKVVRGEATIALGMSEPEAGSDVAAVQTRARPVEGGWQVDGQKMFTTNGHVADYVFLLARTDPASERHRGLTTFLIPRTSEGFEAQGVFTVSGERTNITFYADLFLEDRWRISEVGAGWQSLMLALQDEHSAPFSPHLDRILGAAETWAAAPSVHSGARPLEREDVRRRLVRAATDLEVARLLEIRSTFMESTHDVPVAEGPMSKLFSTEAVVRHAEQLSAMAGPDALRSRLDPTALGDGEIEHGLRYSLGMTIYGGTSEIQRNIIAQRRCGLARPSPPPTPRNRNI